MIDTGTVRSHYDSRRIATWLAMGLALVAVPTYGLGQVSLSTVVDLAQKNSTEVRIANADVQKTRAQLAQSKDVVIPTLNFGSGIPAFPEEGFTGSPPSIWNATVQSLAFSIPQKRYIDAARSAMHAAGSRLKDAREQAALDASTAYIELDTVDRKLQAAREQEEDALRLVDIEEKRAEAGVDPLSELLQAKLTHANIRLNRVHLETQQTTLAKQLAVLTGLPLGSITPDHASIPEIPKVTADLHPRSTPGVTAARLIALSKQRQAKGDEEFNLFPQLSFFAQYNRNTTLLNNVNYFFAHPLPANNFSSGFAIQVPLFDMGHRAKAHESEADALRATVEAEQADHQNDFQVAQLTASLRELDAQQEVASLKQQISAEQLKTVETQLQSGNGAGGAPGAPAQLSPKAEQLAQIDERQKFSDSLDADLELAKARLSLLRALGHMQDWLNELHTK